MNTRGSVLLGFLLLMSAISLMSLWIYDAVSLQSKFARFYREKTIEQQVANTVLKKAERLLPQMRELRCVYPLQVHNQFFQNNKMFWLQHSHCQIAHDNFSTAFVIEIFDSQPCVKFVNSHAQGASFYRITAASWPNQHQAMHNLSVVQSYVAVPSQLKLQCSEGEYLSIERGRQTWAMVAQ